MSMEVVKERIQSIEEEASNPYTEPGELVNSIQRARKNIRTYWPAWVKEFDRQVKVKGWVA
jgi:hypothetical protein